MEAVGAAPSLRGPLSGAAPSLHGPLSGAGALDLGLSSDSLEDSDTDSLCEERRYQSELQNRIQSEYQVNFQTQGDNGAPRAEVTPVPDQGSGGKPNSRPREINTSYSELRYDPDWRKHQNRLQTSDQDDQEEPDVSPSEDSDGADTPSFWKPLTNVASQSQKITATAKPKPKESGQERRRGAHQDAEVKKTAQRETAKKDIIEENKVTLGVRKERTQSYLHMHKKRVEENKAGENESSIVQLGEDGSSQGEEGKLPGAIEESGLAGGREKTPKTLNMSSDIRAAQWQTGALFSGKYDDEYITLSADPDGYRDSIRRLDGSYSVQELLQMYNEASYYGLPEKRYGRQPMETMEGAQDSWEMYMYHRLSQNGTLTQPEHSGITYDNLNDVFLLNQITPQTYTSMEKSSSESEAKDRGSNERTRPCPSGGRKPSEKHRKRLQGLLNQEVKLGGLGPAQTVSEEKKEQLKQQKEYGKVIQERNRKKTVKPREIQVTHDDKKRSTRQKSLEYARSVPRPQPVPGARSRKSADVPEKRAESYDSLFPQMKLLEDLQVRHEKEKMAVAALSALHIL